MSILATLALLSPSAAAAPYQVVAIYEGDGTTLEVPIADGTTIPDRGDEYRLQKVILRFEQTGLGATSLSTYRNFSVGVKRPNDPEKDTFSVEVAKIDPTFDLTLFEGATGLTERVSPIEVDVRAKFLSEFLCGQELLLRNTAQPRTTTKAPSYYQGNKQPERPILDDSGTELLYSYCPSYSVKWSDVAKDSAYRFGRGADADEVKEEHKKRLAKKLAASGTLARLNESEGGVQVAADQPDQSINVYVEQTFHFQVMHTAMLFTVAERSHNGDPSHRVALDSRSKLTLTSPLERSDCTDLEDEHLSYWIADEESKVSPVAAKTVFRHTCGVELGVDLSDHLQEKVEVSAVWDLEGKGKLTLYREDFEVHQLGLVTSFPVVSEIAAAVAGGSATDIAAASSVPFGAAVPFDGGPMQAAVMLPWKLGVNTRDVPNLASYVSVFPHVTFFFDTTGDSGTAPVAGLGAGISLAEAFHFAWAVQPKTGDHFLVVGLSVQDIAELSNLF